MSRARIVRWIVIGVCGAGIAGMIVGSVADNNAVALTFGLVTAAAVLCLIVATAVSPAPRFDDDRAARVEELIGRLVSAGADEAAVRALAREAVRLGRGRQKTEIPQIPAPNADD